MNKFDVTIINPFLSSTEDVLSTMAALKPQQKPMFVKKETNMRGDVTGVVGMSGEGFSGVFAISFKVSVVYHVIEKMTGVKPEGIDDPLVKDAVGEIANIIFGNSKKKLNEINIFLQKAIPTVVTGINHSISQFTNQIVLVIPYDSEKGEFFIEITWEN